MAFANPLITATAVEATEFPDLARLYQVSGVPKTIVFRGAGAPGVDTAAVEILGAVPQDAFVEQTLLALTAGGPEDQAQ